MDILGGIADIFNVGSQERTNQQNRMMQYESWKREDNAVQRRKADLEKAGLSPVLAAGSAAQSSAPIRVDAPQMSFSNQVQRQNMENAKAQMALTDAQIAKTAMDTENADAEGFLNRSIVGELRRDASNGIVGKGTSYGLARAMIDNKVANLESQTRDYLDNVYNSDLSRKYGLPTTYGVSDDIANTMMLDKAIGIGGPGMAVLTNTLGGIVKTVAPVVTKKIPNVNIRRFGK